MPSLCREGFCLLEGLSRCVTPIRDVDCCIVDGATAMGDCCLIQSGGSAHISTVETSKCVDDYDRPVESSPVLSGWRFLVGGGMRLIRETFATVSVDLSTRRNR